MSSGRPSYFSARSFAVIALLIKRDSRGPVFFRQVRMGRRERTFRIFKFRTMVADADVRKAEVAHLNQASSERRGPTHVQDRRRSSRDSSGSIPAAVLARRAPAAAQRAKGEMSLVGPRPLILEEDQHVSAWGTSTTQSEAGLYWAVAGRGAQRHPLRRDGHARLSVRHWLVAPQRLQADRAHDSRCTATSEHLAAGWRIRERDL